MSKRVLGHQSEDQGESLAYSANQRFHDDSILPVQFREQLIGMFGQIDKEFENLYQENVLLRDRVEALENAVGVTAGSIPAANADSAGAVSNSTFAGQLRMQQGRDAAAPQQLSSSTNISGRKTGAGGSAGLTTTPIAKRFMKAGASMRSKIQQHPAFSSRSGNTDSSRTKLSSGSSSVSCALLHSYTGHIDGLWEVHACSTRAGLLGTASADRTAGLFDMNSGCMLQQYVGHAGSVNSIRFAESAQTGDLWALTASGDQTAHLWCVTAKPLPVTNNTVNLPNTAGETDDFDGVTSSSTAAQQLGTSNSADFYQQYAGGGDDLPDYAKFGRNFPSGGGLSSTITTRDSLRKFRSHSSVVSCADFLGGATDFIITASWDRTACLHDVQTGEQVNCLSGHDDELTHVSSHRQLRLFATSSRDSTLRLWDFRDPIHSVSVFQGHTDVVTSTVFTPASDGNIVVSGSDDRTVKTWDLRNMRSAISVARFKSGVNRLSVCRNQVGVPLDNGQIYILDLTTGKLIRLPLLSKLNKSTTTSSQTLHHQQSHSRTQQHGSLSSSRNTISARIVTSVAWLENNNPNSAITSSSRPRTTSRTLQNTSAGDSVAVSSGVDAVGSSDTAAAAAAAAVQAASNVMPTPTASTVAQQQRTVTAPGGASAKPNVSDIRDVAITASAQGLVTTSTPSSLTLPASSMTLPTLASGAMSECNFFSSSFERGVAYGWRLENLYSY